MDYYLILLRLIHIGTGVFWAGAAIYLAAFISPAVKALGPEGGKFMQQLSMTNKFPLVMLLNSSFNIISGFLLMWYFSDGFSNQWMGSDMGIVLSIGGTIAFIAYLIGMFVTRPAVMKIAAISKEAASKQQPLNEGQIQMMNAMKGKVGKATTNVAWMISIVVVMMAIARYV